VLIPEPSAPTPEAATAETLRLLLRTVPDLLLRVDSAGTLLGYKLSDAFQAQVPLADLIGELLFPHLPPDTAEVFRRGLARAQAGATNEVLEYTLAGGEGLLTRELRVVAAPDDYYLFMIRDLSQQRAAEEQLRLMATLFEHTREGVVVCDGQWRVEAVNGAFREITGYTSDDVVQGVYHPLEAATLELRQELSEELERGGTWRGEVHARRKNGEFYPQWLTVTAVHDRDGELTHYLEVFTDLSKRGPMTRRLGYLHHYDALTGLPNERLLLERLSKAIATCEREQRRLALLRCDYNQFRAINDTLGYEVGDRILAEVAERLRAVAKLSDTCARLHADDYVLVLEDLGDRNPNTKATELLASLAVPYEIDGEVIDLAPCVGIALYPTDARRADALLRNAGVARDRLKSRDGAGFEYYGVEPGERALERNQVEQALRRALDEHQLVLHYQPKVDVITQRVLGVEALIRWRHPTRGLVPPGEFVPVAEDTGLILPIGEWVLDVACRQAKAWQSAGFSDLSMAVNLSPIQLQDERLLETVAQVLSASGLDPASLELEITESQLLEDLEGTLALLHEFKQRGIKLSLDDFGTGHSSLSLLCQLPIDALKIDKSFLDRIPESLKERAILDAIVTMGHSLKLAVIAEGVESLAQLDALKETGCDQLQGYYFSRPLPADELKALLLRQRDE
jgi:diguanylate cyclase (GGDEF)-like protein/PAS domain S-box-containing protein